MARRRGRINLSLSRSIGGGAEKNGEGAKKQKFCRKNKKKRRRKKKNVEERVKLLPFSFYDNSMLWTRSNFCNNFS